MILPQNSKIPYLDAVVSPILTFNSEVWGAYAKFDLKSWNSSQIEKTHLQFRYVIDAVVCGVEEKK